MHNLSHWCVHFLSTEKGDFYCLIWFSRCKVAFFGRGIKKSIIAIKTYKQKPTKKTCLNCGTAKEMCNLSKYSYFLAARTSFKANFLDCFISCHVFAVAALKYILIVVIRSGDPSKGSVGICLLVCCIGTYEAWML